MDDLAPPLAAALPGAAEMLRLGFLFCPDPGRGNFTPTYDADPPAPHFASVNAGSGRSLRVGGSGLNGQFEKDLAMAGQPVAEFQRVHQGLMRLACASPGSLVRAPPELLQHHGGLLGAFARAADSDGHGFVVVDFFREGSRPKHTANIAMVYCVGPDRRQCSSDDEFLCSLSMLGEGVGRTCSSYNSFAIATSDVDSFMPLQRVRMGLVSGGKYAGSVPKVTVARFLLIGLARGIVGEGLPLEASGFSVELAYDDGVFELAWSELCARADAAQA